jgi:SAM-dependent methyltransferase
MVDLSPARGDGARGSGAYIRADQPWSDALLAGLFDHFRYDADLPLYLELAATQGGRVLEVACGTGRILVPLAEAGHRVFGLDASPHMLAQAREKLAARAGWVNGRAELRLGDMRSFELGECFDLAILPTKSFAYLRNRTEQLDTLRAVAAHLRAGGLLVLDLLHPSPAWLARPDGSLHQDIIQEVPELGLTILRTETIVSTDLAEQLRQIRSAYEIIAADGSVTKRVVEWTYRFSYRFEAEHLLERAGFEIEALYGGYQREPFSSASRDMLFFARAHPRRTPDGA